MDTLYKKSNDLNYSHAIESKNILCCAETGRVIAVFYNEHDLDNIMKQHKKLKELGGVENYMAQSNQAHQEALRKRRRDAGLCRYEYWVSDAEKTALDALLKKLREPVDSE